MSESGVSPDMLSGLSSDEKRAMLAALLQARRDEPKVYRLSATQRRLWFFEQLEPGTSVLHVPIVARMRRAIDCAALERALAALATRHETLRTSIQDRHGEPHQVVASAADVHFRFVDLRTLASEERTAEAARLMAEDSTAPFDLAVGPLWRATLIGLESHDYQLQLTLHHLISDGLSVGIAMRDLAELYAAELERREPRLPPLALSYGQFAEQQLAHAERARREMDYWRTQLAAPPPALELPTDFARPHAQTFRASAVHATLTTDEAGRVRALSREHGATPFMTLLAVFTTHLARLTGSDDLIVGAPVAGRTTPGVELLIGPFINTLALRTRLADDPSFVELLARVKATALAAYAHQDLPFDAIVAELHPARSSDRTPLFQVMFNMIDLPRAADEAAAHADLTVSDRSDISAKFDITLYVRGTGDGLDLILVYNADLFAPARMSEWLAQFQHLVRQVIDRPASPLSQLSLLTPSAARVLPNPIAPLSVSEQPAILERLRSHARERPSAIAVEDRDGRLTYAELEQRTDALAGQLQAQGIGHGDVVAIWAHRSAPLAQALLAILAIGAVFCVLDPAYPAQRVARILSAARPRAWIQLADTSDPPPEAQEALAPCHRFFVTRQQQPPSTAVVQTTSGAGLSPHRDAYLAFTSGTTGAIKAIVGTERPLGHFFAWQSGRFGLDRHDRFSMLSGLSHDPLLRDIFMPLWLGAALVVPEPGEVRDAERLARWCHERRISVAHLTPAHLRILADGAQVTGLSLPDLHHLFVAGEALTTATVTAARAAAPHAAIVNCYGATETPQVMAYWMAPEATIASDEALPPLPVLPVGQGIDGVQVLVMSPQRRLAGVGELGEICIRTPYLSRGYRDDDDLTRQRFVVNPFTKDADDRLYRTGDRGRYRADGAVEFAGRSDLQVKVRGFRVELQEIEQTLLRHPAVAEAAVILRQPADTDPQIVACIVLAMGHEPPTTEALRTLVAEMLPDYAVPAQFELVSRLPMTPNAKIDRAALAARSRQALASSHIAPRTETERVLAKIWREVLRVDDIGVRDVFFEHGGHSLLAMQVMVRVRERLDVDVPLRVLFEGPTVEELAATIDTVLAGRGGPAHAEIEREEFEV